MDARYALELDNTIALPFQNYGEASKLTPPQRLAVLEALQEDMSIFAMLTNFAAIVEKLIPISGLSFNALGHNHHVKLNPCQEYMQSFPVIADHNLLGKLTFASTNKLSSAQNKILRELSKLLSRPLNLALSFYKLEQQVKQDHLTNIGNRACFDESMQRAIEQNSRTHSGLVLMLMDLNKFKAVNDTYGHKAGDEVLIAFAKILTRVIRTSDLAFRFGGDEFALQLQPADSQAAKAVSERIKQQIEQDPTMQKYQVGTAIGYANWQPGMSCEALFEEADERLYQNKNHQ